MGLADLTQDLWDVHPHCEAVGEGQPGGISDAARCLYVGNCTEPEISSLQRKLRWLGFV